MKKVLRAYKKTVSIVNETAIWMYENLGSDRVGFLMESNEKKVENIHLWVLIRRHLFSHKKMVL